MWWSAWSDFSQPPEEMQGSGASSVLVWLFHVIKRKPKEYWDGIFPFGFLKALGRGWKFRDSKSEQGERMQLPRSNVIHWHLISLTHVSATPVFVKTNVSTGLYFACEHVYIPFTVPLAVTMKEPMWALMAGRIWGTPIIPVYTRPHSVISSSTSTPFFLYIPTATTPDCPHSAIPRSNWPPSFDEPFYTQILRWILLRCNVNMSYQFI